MAEKPLPIRGGDRFSEQHPQLFSDKKAERARRLAIRKEVASRQGRELPPNTKEPH